MRKTIQEAVDSLSFNDGRIGAMKIATVRRYPAVLVGTFLLPVTSIDRQVRSTLWPAIPVNIQYSTV